MSLERNRADVGPTFPPYTPANVAGAPRLGRAFAETSRSGTDLALAELRDATVAFVERLKDDGLPPERVVIALKAALVEHGGLASRPSLYVEPVQKADVAPPTLYSRVFGWCIAAYYPPDD